jgi:hypothetical protein
LSCGTSMPNTEKIIANISSCSATRTRTHMHTRVSSCTATTVQKRERSGAGKCLDFGVRAHAKSFDKGAKSERIGREANQAGPVLEECAHGVQAHHPARPALLLRRLFLLGVLGGVPGLGREDLRVRVRNRRQQALQSTNKIKTGLR